MEKVTQSIEEWLFRYFAGQLDADEEKELVKWLGEDPAHRARLAATAERWALLHAPRFAEDRQRNFETRFSFLWGKSPEQPLGKDKQAAGMQAGHKQAAKQSSPGKRRFWMYPAFRVAAFFVALLSVGLFAYQAGRGYRRPEAPLAVTFEASTPLGSKSRLVLPDQTVVWLNAGSSLKCTGGFGANSRPGVGAGRKTPASTRHNSSNALRNGRAQGASGGAVAGSATAPGTPREVWLEGEAYFEVAPDSLRPFIVRSEKLRVRVTGTHFDVRAYPDEEIVDVALVSGKVYVCPDDSPAGSAGAASSAPRAGNRGVAAPRTAAHKEVELVPDRMLSYNKETNCVQLSEISGADVSAWTKGSLRFHDRSFRRIAKDLERKFNVPIRVESRSLAREVFTGSFPEALSLDEILREIDVEHKYVWRREKGTVVIRDR